MVDDVTITETMAEIIEDFETRAIETETADDVLIVVILVDVVDLNEMMIANCWFFLKSITEVIDDSFLKSITAGVLRSISETANDIFAEDLRSVVTESNRLKSAATIEDVSANLKSIVNDEVSIGNCSNKAIFFSTTSSYFLMRSVTSFNFGMLRHTSNSES